jgi:hypothetical protein
VMMQRGPLEQVGKLNGNGPAVARPQG